MMELPLMLKEILLVICGGVDRLHSAPQTTSWGKQDLVWHHMGLVVQEVEPM